MDILDMPDEPWRRKKTAVEKLQEDLQRHLAPFRQWEAMNDLIQRSSSAQSLENLFKQSDPSRHLKETLERLTLPQRIQDLLGNSSALIQAQRMLDQYLPKHQLISDQAALLRGLTPGTEQQEWFRKIQDQALGGHSILEISRQLGYANPALSALESAKATLDSLTNAFSGVNVDEFDFDESNNDEVQQTANAITQAAIEEPTLQAAVDQIVAAIQTQPNPSVQMLLWLFFRKMMDWIIAGIIGAVISQHMPQTAPQSPQEAVKNIKAVARAAIDSPTLLDEFRFVSAKVLLVRQNPKARSPILGELRFGKSVKLLKKEKDFALVLWTDRESGVEIQGWVFARYLGKFD